MSATRAPVAVARPATEGQGGVAVVVQDVVKSFGQVRALRGASLAIAASEFVTITGPSGSGKSTLVNLIGSLDRPDSGTITVGGAPVPEPRHALEFRQYVVGFVFQDNLLLPYLSAQSNIEAALLGAGMGRRERRARSSELLDEVGLSDRAQPFPPSFPAGSARPSRSPGRSPTTPGCCSQTSRPARSIRSAPDGRSTFSPRSAIVTG